MNFFKYVMIVLLKMHASDMPFFFQYRYGLCSGDRETQFFGGGNIQQKGKVQTFWLAGRPPKYPPFVGQPDLPSGKSLGGCLIYLL